MKRILFSLAALTLTIIVGCTAAQLGQATADIGGTPNPKATTQQAAVILAQQATAEGATFAAVAPFPFGTILASILGITSAVLGVFLTKQTSAINTANSVIAAAAPGVSQLVKQTTDNQTLATDITAIAQIAPGVISLLAHPAAQAAVTASAIATSTPKA